MPKEANAWNRGITDIDNRSNGNLLLADLDRAIAHHLPCPNPPVCG